MDTDPRDAHQPSKGDTPHSTTGSMSKRLATGGAWVLGSRFVISGFGLAYTIILARLLVPEDFGLVAIAATIALIAAAATELSMSEALVQNPDPSADHYNTAFTLNVLRALGLSLLLVALSKPIANLYEDLRLVAILWAIAGANIITGFKNPRLAMMLRNLVFWQDFVLRFGEKLFSLAAAVTVALIWQSYWALIAGMVAGQLVSVILSYVIVPFWPRINLSKWRELFSFSIWLTLRQLVNQANWNLDKLLLGYVLGTRELGFYTVGDRLAGVPTREVTAPVAQVAFPGFTKMAGDIPRLQRGYTRAQTLLTAAALATGIGFAVAAEPFVLFFLGEQWQQVVPVIQVLAGVFALQTIGTPVQPLCMALGKTKILFIRSLITFGIRVPLVVAGLLLGGLPGLLAARLVTGMIGLGINIWLVAKLIGLSPFQQIWANRRSLVSTGAMAAAVWFVGAVWGDAVGMLLALKVLVMCLTMIVTFPVTLFFLWRIEGCPFGPEEDILKGVISIRRRLRRAA